MTGRHSLDRSMSAGCDALEALLPVLACPTCRHPSARLLRRSEALSCDRCKTRFPLYRSGAAAIPWLFRDPEATRAEWRARFNGFMHANAGEQTRLKLALETKSLTRTARARIERLLAARETQRKQVGTLLAPLELGAPRAMAGLDGTRLLYSKLPKQLGLLGYCNNVLRDWSWDNAENESLLECVRRVMAARPNSSLGRLLTLGAGACRLSYDLHRCFAPELSVALDVNPLLLFLASRVLGAESVPFYEFPIAPLNEASFAIPRICSAPEPLADGAPFSLVAADCLNAPFKAASFDTVLTPWLIDIIPENLTDFARRVNQLLASGGSWLNTGSLAFAHRDESWRHSEEEVRELLAANGFEVIAAERRTVPYMQSPASAHGRIERIFSFNARKVREAPAPEHRPYLPPWLLHPDQPVPDLDEFVVAAAHHLLQAQILSTIDGCRSVDEIARLVADHYGLRDGEAHSAVHRIIMDLYESGAQQATDPASELE